MKLSSGIIPFTAETIVLFLNSAGEIFANVGFKKADGIATKIISEIFIRIENKCRLISGIGKKIYFKPVLISNNRTFVLKTQTINFII